MIAGRSVAAGRVLRRITDGRTVVAVPAPDSFGLPGVASAAAEARRSEFGALGDGSRVEAVELANGQGDASPEAALGGGLALLRNGDRVRIDLRRGEANILISDEELNRRRQSLQEAGGHPIPPSQTPWQEMQRAVAGQADSGAALETATKHQRLVQTQGVTRHNH